MRKPGIEIDDTLSALRFHLRCFWVSAVGNDRHALPAMLAAVTDAKGQLTGLHRTWLARNGTKANIHSPRRALGILHRSTGRFGEVSDTVFMGEAIETVLALRSVLPSMPGQATLCAYILLQLEFQLGLQRLIIAQGNDQAGKISAVSSITCAELAGIHVMNAQVV